MEIILLVALILLNGVFAMSEIALVTARRGRLTRLAEDGDAAAVVAIKLGEEPTRFLSTIQIGITSIGILNGIVGEAALAAPLAMWLQELGLAQRPSEIGATVLVVVVITYVSIVVGELVPKRIGQINPEGIARLVARPMNALSVASRPFVRLLSWSTVLLLTLMGKRDEAAPGVTEEEIHALLEEGSEAGVIEKNEHEMVRNVFRLDERQIASLMVPRSDVVWLDITLPLDDNLARMAESEHSRFPVCRGGLDDILGIISSKQLFNQTLKGGTTDLTKQLEPAIYVPESLTGMELLDQFRASSTHMVFVIDEYGEIQGVVTLQDVLEAVTGEFRPASLDEAWAVQREDGSWLLDGMIPVPELKDRLEIKAVPEEDKGRYHTLSGMVMWLLGRIPHTGDVTTWEDWRLEVVDLDGKRIDKVLATRLVEISAEQEAPSQADTPPAD
ncbi:CBS domain-containing protein [Azoarcus sp. CIB]|uniref:hemolysin family protein n=1 Tax=Aromatoleum sp. (strain CIB) TaxID=198107 RepID=UPI00067E2D4C|nr:hemolysin family protein [Azoarcus sp. CIB]AKU13654.1 CBS domain-containing protein [Azoarcus sp. CIB]